MLKSKKDIYLWLSLGLGVTTILTGAGSLISYFGFGESRTQEVSYVYLSNTNLGEADNEVNNPKPMIPDKDDPSKNVVNPDFETIVKNKSVIGQWDVPSFYPVRNNTTEPANLYVKDKNTKMYWQPSNPLWMKISENGTPPCFSYPCEFQTKNQMNNFVIVKMKLGIGTKNILQPTSEKDITVQWAGLTDWDKINSDGDKSWYTNKKLKVIQHYIYTQMDLKSRQGFHSIFSSINKKNTGAMDVLQDNKKNALGALDAAKKLLQQIEDKVVVIQNRFKFYALDAKDDPNNVNAKWYKDFSRDISESIESSPSPLKEIVLNQCGTYTYGDGSKYAESVAQFLGIYNEIYSKTPSTDLVTNTKASLNNILEKNVQYLNSRQSFLDAINLSNTLLIVALSLGSVALLSLFLVLTFFIIYTTKKNKEEYGDTDELDYMLL